ncbi:MAG: hypothetical protein HOC91_17770 [Nitrospinaceae bacterium]|nr:hypothetical protein [Nitrospinaceae bacterium]MBT4094717.1 hypothetical protein [Nitrospinaceae bacterium]MBT4432361.1 hypothetical protein [Nitrospinaceae bacterium]MBT5368082.1 hypothetical protein [Nitrospinaceae bacterium]MBT6394831.1 hypothetical protein [Nitrospinaceae bacterium]
MFHNIVQFELGLPMVMPIGTSGVRRKALIAGKIDAAVMHVESVYQAASMSSRISPSSCRSTPSSGCRSTTTFLRRTART